MSLAGVLRAAGVIIVPNLKLVTVAAALGVTHDSAHRAMSDCLAAKGIFDSCVAIVRSAGRGVVIGAAP